jgi:protein SPT2
VAPSKPSPTNFDASKAPPKKGSFAEIMARGAKAQQVMGKVGVIQHKATERPLSKKDREAAKQEQKADPKAPMKKGYSGNARPGGQGSRDIPKNGISTKDGKQATKRRPGSSGEEAPEKKVKKSATATTGYTGTARPTVSSKPGSSRNGSHSTPYRGALAPPKAARRSRYDDDEEDEELDDFIDYDDEEDEMDVRGRRYEYADSDASSDMEAGMDDIDGEERRAEYLAREEDRREQALEEKLRREKEERKRRWTHQSYR